jgi:hypothetical protein
MVLRIGLGIAVAVTLVVVGLGIGWHLWGRSLWAAGPFAMPRAAVGPGTPGACGEWRGDPGPGMMGKSGAQVEPCAGWSYGASREAANSTPDKLTIDEAHEAVERYIARQGYSNMEISEVMEFERNFYAIVQEAGTGIGAMELLVDKWAGTVGPEMGPNMMWNGRYGMHRRGMEMMGGASETNALSSEEALEIAQRWLDTSRPGTTVEEHADPFYGYYTIHTMKDGQVEGMLSVHGTTGQVWYHTWHGDFIQMIEHGDDH